MLGRVFVAIKMSGEFEGVHEGLFWVDVFRRLWVAAIGLGDDMRVEVHGVAS